MDQIKTCPQCGYSWANVANPQGSFFSKVIARRNAEIFERSMAYETAARIAVDYGISGGRIGQIIKNVGRRIKSASDLDFQTNTVNAIREHRVEVLKVLSEFTLV